MLHDWKSLGSMKQRTEKQQMNWHLWLTCAITVLLKLISGAAKTYWMISGVPCATIWQGAGHITSEYLLTYKNHNVYWIIWFLNWEGHLIIFIVCHFLSQYQSIDFKLMASFQALQICFSFLIVNCDCTLSSSWYYLLYIICFCNGCL